MALETDRPIQIAIVKGMANRFEIVRVGIECPDETTIRIAIDMQAVMVDAEGVRSVPIPLPAVVLDAETSQGIFDAIQKQLYAAVQQSGSSPVELSASSVSDLSVKR